MRAALPLGRGVIFDPFAGSGSTLAAAEAVGYASIGLEKDPAYFKMAEKAIPALASLRADQATLSQMPKIALKTFAHSKYRSTGSAVSLST